MKRHSQIVLCSSSPRRQELLKQIGVSYQLVDPGINEVKRPNETGPEYVKRLALEKAFAGARLTGKKSGATLLGADTCVVIEGSILGKPENFGEFKTMMQTLSGNTHEVLTAVAIIEANKYDTMELAEIEKNNVRLSVTKVTFRKLSKSDYYGYWETGEPLGKAGGYAIQGKASIFIENIEGSYSGVVGLPLFETSELLRKHSIEILPVQVHGNKL